MRITLRPPLIAAALLCGAVSSGFAVAAPHIPSRMAVAPGEKAPSLLGIAVPTGEWRTIDWSKNKVTLVNFWATWCEPCKLEMPVLQHLNELHAADGLAVVGVLKEEISPEAAAVFIGALGVGYEMMVGHKHVSETWGGIGTLPTSFLIDHEGTVLRRYVGAAPDQAEVLIRDVEDALAGRRLSPMPPREGVGESAPSTKPPQTKKP